MKKCFKYCKMYNILMIYKEKKFKSKLITNHTKILKIQIRNQLRRENQKMKKIC